MQWKVSENVIEEKLLSNEWAKMSDSDVEYFLGLGVVEAKETVQKSHENIPEDLEGAQTSSPGAESTMDVAGTNEHKISGDLEEDPYDFFEEFETDDEFIIHSNPIDYEDSVYNRVYTSCFNNDSFF